MPLHEFVRMSGRMHESGQQTQFSTDLSSRGFDNLAELVWENGQIMVQGQSSKFSRAPAVNYLPPTNPRPRAGAARVGKFVGLESLLGDKSPVVPSGDLDLSQDDEMAPWLGYPFDVALVQEYGSELLPEVSVVTANGLPTQNSLFPVADKRSCFQQAVSNFHSDDHTLKASSSSKASLQCSWLPQNRQRSDGVGSGVSDIISNNTTNHMGTIFGNPNQGRDMLNDAGCKKVDRLGKEPFMSNSTLLNFSHFSRATGLMKTNLHNPIGNHASVLRIIEKVDAKGKCSATRGSSAVDYLTTGGVNNSHKNPDFHISYVTDAMVGSIQPAVKPAFESCIPERNENSCKEDLIKNDNTQVLSIHANSVKEVPNVERAVDPVVACSSVGSGKSADRVSCDHTNNQKRKFRDIEESGSQSDDIDTESIGGQKSIPDGVGTRSKRSRAAEVHNLSERRRRDRINEKMRALQELIPNCNKTDKASMLDEAIEYLKMLQLQVQMMSMGAGLYMPPMMFPTGFQQIPHFPTMGFGMGMGMGMGMVDSVSHVFPQIPHFTPILGPSNFLGIPSPSLPVYGQPGQGLIGSFPRPQLFPLAAQAPTIPNVRVSPANANGGHNEVIMASSALNTVVPVTDNTTSHLMCAAEAGSSVNQKSNQLRATAEKFDQSTRATDSTCPPAATSIDKEPGSG